MKNNNSNFLVVTFNCNGWKSSKTELQFLLGKIEECLGSKPQIIMLQECFMDLEIQEIRLQEYRMVAWSKPLKVRRKSKIGNRRGSAILAHETLNVQKQTERSKDGVELIGVSVVGEAGQPKFRIPFEVWNIYNPPENKLQAKCSSMIQELCEEKGRVILAGDFNCNINPIGHSTRPKILKKLEYLRDKGKLIILNENVEPTTKKRTTIDLAVTMGDWEGGFAFPIEWDLNSDHFPVCIGIGIAQKNKRVKVEYIETPRFLWSEETEEKVKEELRNLKMESQSATANELAIAIQTIFKAVPKNTTTKKKSRQKKHWWSEKVRKLFVRKQELLEKMLLNKKDASPTLQASHSQEEDTHDNSPVIDRQEGHASVLQAGSSATKTETVNQEKKKSGTSDEQKKQNATAGTNAGGSERTTSSEEEFREAKKEFQDEVKKEKNKAFQDFASNLSHHNNNRAIYKAIKNLGTSGASRISELTLITMEGKAISSIEKKATLLAKRYQVPLGTHPKRKKERRRRLNRKRKQKERENPRGKGCRVFTEAEARVARAEMASNKAPGYSRLRKEDLEKGSCELDTLVAQLATKTAKCGKWPQILKSGVTCPLPKKKGIRDTVRIDETRPITLLEVLDKWLQKLIYNRIKPYVKYHETQAGYVLSCEHHTSLLSDFVKNRKDRAYTFGVFTDISKAFDSVPTQELKEVIWESDIPSEYKWVLASFVEKRTYKVEIRNEKGETASSKWTKMLYGTPQGSVLGPMLWNMFFNPLLEELEKVTDLPGEENQEDIISKPDGQQRSTDLTNREPQKSTAKKNGEPQKSAASTNGEPQNETAPTNYIGMKDEVENLDLAFADDLTLLAASTDPEKAEQILEWKLQIFGDFLEERGMEAAPHKLKIMSMDPLGRDYKPRVNYRGQAVEVVDQHTILGIVYDKDMTFVKHWEFLTSAINGRINVMRTLCSAKWGPTQQTMKVLHKCYIESKIRYGILSWYPFLHQRYRRKLEAQLKKSIRLAVGLPITCNNLALLAEADLDTVEDLASKSAVSFYVQLNPLEEHHTTLAKRRYKEKKPKWTKLLEKVPEEIWGGEIQTRLESKFLLATDKVYVEKATLETGEQAREMEANYSRILYTDASVRKVENEKAGRGKQPGEAAAAYIWYDRDGTGNWRETKKESFHIGAGHSSYSAEAIAIEKGLQGDPQLTQDPNDHAGINLPGGDRQEGSRGGMSGALAAPRVTKPETDTLGGSTNLKPVGIFTDSLSNLETIAGCIAETEEQKALLKTISDYPYATVFHHVRAHRDNLKNIAVDRLCDVTQLVPGRRTTGIQGTKTSAKIKHWMKEWTTDKRLCNVIRKRMVNKKRMGSAPVTQSVTQSWIRRLLQDSNRRMLPKPQIQYEIPRRQGALLSKVRTNNWTSCYTYLNWIKPKEYPSKNCGCAKMGSGEKTQTLEHLLNHCELNEEPRELMFAKLRATGKLENLSADVLDLVTSKDKEVVKRIGIFLEEIDDIWNGEEERRRSKKEAMRKSIVGTGPGGGTGP
jgi:hypothetical protein